MKEIYATVKASWRIVFAVGLFLPSTSAITNDGGSILETRYVKVDIEVSKVVGGEPAMLLSYLKMRHKTLRVDDHGYFFMDAKYVERGIGFNRNKFHQCRRRLVEAGYLEFIGGGNQNTKPRYKVLK